jgi:hypothetical protein
MSNWAFVGLSFGLTWVVLLGYTVTLFQRARRARVALEVALQAEQAAAALSRDTPAPLAAVEVA